VVNKVALGQFPPNILVSPANFQFTNCYTLIIIYHPGLGTIGQTMADVPSGLSLTPPKETKKNPRQDDVNRRVSQDFVVTKKF
jgi:hypothetical protein